MNDIIEIKLPKKSLRKIIKRNKLIMKFLSGNISYDEIHKAGIQFIIPESLKNK